ncbi:hypothetical protein H4582DRAFT_405975 [Lactarius indigo]|nr:hypothetical protein H4582DRAFT_405975 [Lactarius indigo]
MLLCGSQNKTKQSSPVPPIQVRQTVGDTQTGWASLLGLSLARCWASVAAAVTRTISSVGGEVEKEVDSMCLVISRLIWIGAGVGRSGPRSILVNLSSIWLCAQRPKARLRIVITQSTICSRTVMRKTWNAAENHEEGLYSFSIIKGWGSGKGCATHIGRWR